MAIAHDDLTGDDHRVGAIGQPREHESDERVVDADTVDGPEVPGREVGSGAHVDPAELGPPQARG